jgi:hypothetical protein
MWMKMKVAKKEAKMNTINFIYEAVSGFQNLDHSILENGWGDYAYLITILTFAVATIASIFVLATRESFFTKDCDPVKGC